ncbi:MAG TPA: DUF5670 family protein [Terriglobales bacterium]|nr:DUF5670 family protein [Terriglobales bacterium]
MPARTRWEGLCFGRFLLILWLLGLVSSYTLGGYVHLLLTNRAGGSGDSPHSGSQAV